MTNPIGVAEFRLMLQKYFAKIKHIKDFGTCGDDERQLEKWARKNGFGELFD